jgi:glycosyltransferase involved in cell wall biosynthesis
MKIGVTCESLSIRHLVGIGNTTLNLIQKSRTLFPSNEMVPIAKTNEYERFDNTVLVNPPIPKSLYQSYLSIKARDMGLDILHNSCGWLNGVKPTVPSVVTLYDLIPFTHPQYLTRSMGIYWKLFARRNLELATSIVSISQASKQVAVEQCGIPKEKIIVAYPGVDTRFRPVDDPDTVRRFGLEPGNYALFVGSIDPRKNIPLIIRTLKTVAPDLPLAIASGGGWLTKDVNAAIAECENVKFLGYVPIEALPAIYSHAKMMIWPSIVEGFGLPPLEAMACGCPVITSNCSSLPEVVGDAALIIDPTSKDQLARAISTLNGDTGLRYELGRRGIDRAKEFTWDLFATGVHVAYESAVSA